MKLLFHASNVGNLSFFFFLLLRKIQQIILHVISSSSTTITTAVLQYLKVQDRLEGSRIWSYNHHKSSPESLLQQEEDYQGAKRKTVSITIHAVQDNIEH